MSVVRDVVKPAGEVVADRVEAARESEREHPDLPPNFLTIAALAKSYKEIERSFHTKAAEVIVLRRVLVEQQATISVLSGTAAPGLPEVGEEFGGE